MDSENLALHRSKDSDLLEVSNKFRLNTASILLSASGVALLVWACFSPYFRGRENELTGRFCLPLAASFALVLAGIFVGSKWRNFFGWFGLALVGQAASLQMIDAGRLIHFQHYRLLPEIFSKDVYLIVLVALQFAFVAVGIIKHSSAITEWLDKTIGRWRFALIALFLMFAGAAVTPNVSIYVTSLLIAGLVQLINLGNIILLVWSVPQESISWLRQKINGLLGDSNDVAKPRLDRFAWTAALFIVLLAGTLSFFVYEGHPHVPDETQYLFQARYMAAGQLTVKAPPVPEAFAMYMIPHEEERWFSIFPPAYPAVLAVGVMLNAVWLVNPLLAGLCVLLAYLFFQQVYSRRFARIGVLLLCCSPWFVFMAMSLMSHIFTLACALTAAVLLIKAVREQKLLFALFAGLAIGIISLTRPLDGAMVAVLLGVWTLLSSLTLRGKLLTASFLVVGTIAAAALVLPYNQAITGSATLAPLNAYYTKYFSPDVMALGFGAGRGFHWGLDAFPGHSPLEAVVNAALNTFLLNTELFGWGTGSLILAVCFLLSGSLRKKDLWVLAVIAFVVGGYSLFWYHGGPDFGARYWFLCIIPLVALTVRGLEWLGQKTNENHSESNPRVALAVAVLCAVSLLNYFPWRALDKYYHYLEMQPGILQLAERHNFGKSLVLIRGEEHPDYQSAWVYNPLNFEGDAPIYAHDKNPEIRARLLQAYADRPVWTVDAPTRTNGTYKVVQGPVSAQELLAEKNF